MIQLNQMPIAFRQAALPDPVKHDIAEWLRDPRCRQFLSFLAAKAAEEAAIVGNAYIDGQEPSIIGAKDHILMAEIYCSAIEVLKTCALADYEFHYAELKPTPPITTE